MMELGLKACEDDYDGSTAMVSELYKSRRCFLGVEGGELRSCFSSHLEEQLEKDRADAGNYVAYLKLLLDDLVEKPGNGMTEREEGTVSNDDPAYTIFLSHAKRRGKSYLLEFKEEIIHYEREDGTANEHGLEVNKRKMKSLEENAASREHPRGVQGECTKGTPRLLLSVSGGELRGLKTDEDVKNNSPRYVFVGENDYLNQNLHSGKNPVSQNQLKRKMMHDLGKRRKTKQQRLSGDLMKAEEEDQYFLDNIDTLTDFEILPLPNSDRIEGEDDFGSTYTDPKAAACKIESFEHISSADLDGSVEEDDSCQCLDSPIPGTNSTFRQKVISLLKQPYDCQEYKKLWHDVKVREKLMRHLDLRNGRERPYSANKDGKSYLDYYEDLKQKIEAVQYDRRKKLNILRGFFFWLKNLTQEGAFRPWQDAACLAVLPGSCRKV